MLSDVCWNKQYILEGDTLIGAVSYKKLFLTGITVGSDSFAYIYTYWDDGYIGGIREDTLNKKVYYLPKGEISDTLLYDFNLSLGDTLPLTYIYSGSPLVTIDDIDSIAANGRVHTTYHLDGAGWGSGFYLIEGIGSTFGLLEPIIASPDPRYDLLCFKYDGSVTYDTLVSFHSTGCDSLLTGLKTPKIISRFGISIYPNPLTSFATIEATEPLSSLRIYTISGRMAREERNLSSNTITMDRGNLPSGMYFIEVISGNGILARKKVIIQ